MRDGGEGEAVRLALEQQIAVGEFFGAERLVPVGNVHMMGDMEVMGEGGFAFIEGLLAAGARFRVPVTTNPRCVDFERAAALRQRPELVERERALVERLRRLGAMAVDTCINYQTVSTSQPSRAAWPGAGASWPSPTAAWRPPASCLGARIP